MRRHPERMLPLALIAFAALSTPVLALDDITCAGYAKIAVAQQQSNLASGCNQNGPMWNNDPGYHASWCIRQTNRTLIENGNLKRAEILSNCKAKTVCQLGYDVSIGFDRIHVHDEADGNGNAEPYLWPLFYRIDFSAVTNLDDPLNADGKGEAWVFAPGGDHGNLSGDWDAGQDIPVPAALGARSLRLDPRFVGDQSLLGAIVVLMEEDDLPTSSDIRNDHYPEFSRTVSDELTAAFKDALRRSAGLGGSGGGTDSDSVEQTITKRLVASFTEDYGLFVNYFLPWLHIIDPVVNIDDFIGVIVIQVPVSEIDAHGGTLNRTISRRWNDSNGSEDGDFEIFGRYAGQRICAPS